MVWQWYILQHVLGNSNVIFHDKHIRWNLIYESNPLIHTIDLLYNKKLGAHFYGHDSEGHLNWSKLIFCLASYLVFGEFL